MTPAEVELVPPSYVEPLNFAQVFGRRAALEVDLGCGDGSFLARTAAANPMRDYLGIERMRGRVRGTCYKAAQGGLTNVRVLLLESTYAVRYLLPPESVEVFHLLFPDPWPKKRHHRRRVVTPAFLGAIHAALRPDGELRVATDQLDYYEGIIAVAAESALFSRGPANDEDAAAMTTFERRFREDALPIYRLLLRKVSPPR